MHKYQCSVCTLNVGSNSVCCYNCLSWVCFRYSNLTKEEFSVLGDTIWYCPACICDIFPLTNLKNEEIISHYEDDNTLYIDNDPTVNYSVTEDELNSFGSLLNNESIDPDRNYYD